MDIGESSGQSGNEALDSNVEIKIKTLDAQSYTLRVNKNTPVPSLKEQIASVVGVPVESQRLICRGKVLKDDQILSAYNVEDGHTLHLVSRQPPSLSPNVAGSNTNTISSEGQGLPEGAAAPSDLVIVAPQNRPTHVSHSLLMGTINIPDSGEGGVPDLNRIISAVLSSVGIGNAMSAGTSNGVTVGMLPTQAQQPTASNNQTRSEGFDVRHQASAGYGDHPLPRELELQIDALYGTPHSSTSTGTGSVTGTGTLVPAPLRSVQQPMVVPDALTTMSQYLDRLEQSFARNDGPSIQNPEVTATNQGAINVVPGAPLNPYGGTAGTSNRVLIPGAMPVSAATGGSDRRESGLAAGALAPGRQLPTPQALGVIVRRVQELLNGQAGNALARLASQLESEPHVVDATIRTEMQVTALRDGNMMQQLGALLLELGRTTLTLRMGQSPVESVVNAGPAIFISPSGPNPMMVQSLPLQTGVALGALPVGTPQPGGGFVGPSLGPRSINIHIHTSDLRIPSASPPSPSHSPQQPPPRAVVGLTSGASGLTVRQIIERAEATNPEHALTVRQIIERAEAATGVQSGNPEQNTQVTTGGAVQGAIMTFNENGAMRVVPVRTRTAALPGTSSATEVAVTAGMFQPLLSRLQQQVGSLQQGRTPTVAVSMNPTSSNSNQSGSIAEQPQPQPPIIIPAPGQPGVRAQVHLQAWAPPIMQALVRGYPHSLAAVPSSRELQVQVQHPQGLTGAVGNTSSTGSTGGGPTTSQPFSAVVPPVTNSSLLGQDDRNLRDLGAGQQGIPESGGMVDMASIVNSLGPFLNQLAESFQQSRMQPMADVPVQAPQQRSDEEPRFSSEVPSAMETAIDGPVRLLSTANGQLEASIQECMPQDFSTLRPHHVEQPGLGEIAKSLDKMEVDVGTDNPSGCSHVPGSTSTSILSESATNNEGSLQETGRTQEGAITPIGLGPRGLQPLPARSRRRAQVQQPLTGGVASMPGNDRPLVGTGWAAVPPAAQNILHSLASQVDRPSERVEGNTGQFSQGFYPVLSSTEDRVENPVDREFDLGDILGQLMGRAGDGNADNSSSSSRLLGGVVGQLVQSPLMEDIVRQVMTNVGTEHGQDPGHPLTELGNSNQGGFDFAGMMQQMLPVVAQMLGGRQSSSPNDHTAGDMRADGGQNEGGEVAGQIMDSVRWREALTDEEATEWTGTISADVEQQSSMGPQRPFSDVYARGSPVAKRQKTDLEGTAQKLENGASPGELLKSVTENAATRRPGSYSASVNAEESSQLAQHVAEVDGLADAYMAVLFHDLAARVAADPDFGDGSRYPHAARVFQQQKAAEEPAGRRH